VKTVHEWIKKKEKYDHGALPIYFGTDSHQIKSDDYSFANSFLSPAKA
jgi:hypothetical protein